MTRRVFLDANVLFSAAWTEGSALTGLGSVHRRRWRSPIALRYAVARGCALWQSMILPNVAAADVSEDKIVKYLLSTTHRSGMSKAAFFGRFGFTAGKWQELAAALQRHARENPVGQLTATRYGTRYVVDGRLTAPDGSGLNVRSVWFISRGEETPRFVTAHPLRRTA